jgi:hypothetical protein
MGFNILIDTEDISLLDRDNSRISLTLDESLFMNSNEWKVSVVSYYYRNDIMQGPAYLLCDFTEPHIMNKNRRRILTIVENKESLIECLLHSYFACAVEKSELSNLTFYLQDCLGQNIALGINFRLILNLFFEHV